DLKSNHMLEFRNLAATAQEEFEKFMFSYVECIIRKYGAVKNLILTGGCALNCTFNGKLAQKKYFEKIYIPPNPGDEGISVGCAVSTFIEQNKKNWKPKKWENVSSYYGSNQSVPKVEDVIEVFKGFKILNPKNLAFTLSEILAKGEIVALFQGRSEIGPRALGNRSI